jgi:hypothetical protein
MGRTLPRVGLSSSRKKNKPSDHKSETDELADWGHRNHTKSS